MNVSCKSRDGTVVQQSKTMQATTVELIPDAGTCIASRSVFTQNSPVRWMIREVEKFSDDNGWRIFALNDSDEYLQDPQNLIKVDFNKLCMIEPSLIGIWNFPVGSRLQIVDDELGKRIVDTPTGVEIAQDDLYTPPKS